MATSAAGPAYLLYPSPIGPLGLASADGARLSALTLEPDLEPHPERRPDPHPDGERRPAPVFDAARRWLDAYFAGRPRPVHEVPRAAGGTPFQEAVWAALADLPYGRTTSYGALARTLGRPTAARAVAAANGQNPLAILVPCHRVIGTDGTLTGYAGGLEKKRWLLEHEGALTPSLL